MKESVKDVGESRDNMKAIIEVKFRFYNIGTKEIEELLKIVTPTHIKLIHIGDCIKKEREEIYKLLNISSRETNVWDQVNYSVKLKKIKQLREMQK